MKSSNFTFPTPEEAKVGHLKVSSNLFDILATNEHKIYDSLLNFGFNLPAYRYHAADAKKSRFQELEFVAVVDVMVKKIYVGKKSS
jgi:hypothetical protein